MIRLSSLQRLERSHWRPVALLLAILALDCHAQSNIPRVPVAGEVAFSPLADAARNRNMAEVTRLMIADESLDVDAFGSDGTAALHWVARFGDLATADWLIGAGADVDQPNLYGIRPLQIAIENGHHAMVERLLQAGADPEAPDQAGEPPLFLAAALGDLTSIALLLDAGARVDGEDPVYGQSALMLAVRENQPAAARLLLERGADVNKQSLQTQIAPGDQDFLPPSVIPGTLTQGVGIIRGGWPERGIRQPLAGAKTPLLYATRLGDLALVRLLVAAGANLEQADANGITPLINAIINTSIVAVQPGAGQHLEIARYLLAQQADVNAMDFYGETPLWAAIDVRNLIYRNVSTSDNFVDRELALVLIEELLAAGADTNARIREYPPSRHFILGIGSVEWVDMTGQTPFIRAAQSGDISVMQLLLDHGADPNIMTLAGTSALMAAAGVNWAVGQTFDEGEDHLLEAVKLAHSLGNEINTANSMGLQAMHGAANRGANSIIRYLAEHDAELDRPDNQGRTPVRWAEGEYLPSRPLVPKPDTIALIREYQSSREQVTDRQNR